MRQPRIIVVDSLGTSAEGANSGTEAGGTAATKRLPYARLVARLQPLELRIEPAVGGALATLTRDSWDLGIITARQGSTATALLEVVHAADPQLPVVVVDPCPTVATARACLQGGAGDYLDIARVESDLEDALVRLLETARRQAGEAVLRRAVERPYSFEGFLGESPPMRQVYSVIERIAASAVDVLVTGETGTGKELVARAIHRLSRRAQGPFVPVDCGAIPDALLESELFGHEKGAFTDAHDTRSGKFELASGGTLFLDEIGDMSLGGQAKLLRVLEEKVVVRVGGSTAIPVNVRVIAATNQNLVDLVRQKKFREDLYFRLTVVTLNLPPLRHRADDVLQLADFFLTTFCAKIGRSKPTLNASAKKRLTSHPWPGNVRELRNIIERIAYLTTDEVIEDSEIDFVRSPRADGESDSERIDLSKPLAQATDDFQARYIEQQLKACKRNMTLAAERMGMQRSNLYRKMKQLGMNHHEPESSGNS